MARLYGGVGRLSFEWNWGRIYMTFGSSLHDCERRKLSPLASVFESGDGHIFLLLLGEVSTKYKTLVLNPQNYEILSAHGTG